MKVYETLRQKYLPPKYYIFPNVNKFNIFALGFQHLPRDLANINEWKVMFDPYFYSETVIHNVATYLYYAFELRQELLEST